MEIIFGLLLLLAGGDTLVRGSVTVARKIGISELMIGLTLVGFGTSTPELVTSLNAAFAGSPGIAVGNVVGSNIANILLILGITAVIYPVICPPSAAKRDGIALIISALCCLAVTWYGELSRLPGLLFILLIVGYIAYTYLKEGSTGSQPSESTDTSKITETITQKVWFGLLLAAGGIAMTIYGAKLLVDGAIELARTQGISETTIGLTIVAIGTSLPELATSVIAAFRRNADIALGNVIGSNIYNIWFILGATAVIQPIPVPEAIMASDIWVMLAATLLLFGIIWKWQKISRPAGVLFMALYAGYIATMV